METMRNTSEESKPKKPQKYINVGGTFYKRMSKKEVAKMKQIIDETVEAIANAKFETLEELIDARKTLPEITDQQEKDVFKNAINIIEKRLRMVDMF